MAAGFCVIFQLSLTIQSQAKEGRQLDEARLEFSDEYEDEREKQEN
jgi:hypothetical protein